MGYISDYVGGACDCCYWARQNRKGYWYCKQDEDDFPEADWDGPDEYEPSSCNSFQPDPDCYDEDEWIWD